VGEVACRLFVVGNERLPLVCKYKRNCCRDYFSPFRMFSILFFFVARIEMVADIPVQGDPAAARVRRIQEAL
ncbi:hypothetical protein GIB67_018424, partial [Kingdonia uniflora]